MEWMAEILTLLMLAFALGMDAFSVGLGMGMYKLSYRQILLIGLTVGIFHAGMPFLGMLAGYFLSGTFGTITEYIGGGLMLLLGIQMIIGCLRQDSQTIMVPAGWGLIFFSFSVSLDSFSVGLSLGMYGAKIVAVLFSFALVAAVLTWSGLLLGKKVQGWLGVYGELFGGAILVLLGLKLLIT